MASLRKKVLSALAGAALIASGTPSLAEDAAPATALAPGGAAGVEPAQAFGDIPWVFLAGGGLVLLSIGLALTKNETTTSTTGTN